MRDIHFEPQDTGEPRTMLLVIVLIVILCFEVFIGFFKVIEIIKETPKETVNILDIYIETERNP